MVYTSLTSPENRDYTYDLKIAHLYGNLMNTYGDNGNILMLKYVAEKLGTRVQIDIVSLEDEFDKDYYDLAFFGGGQDYEQTIVARDLPAKKDSLEEFINHDGFLPEREDRTGKTGICRDRTDRQGVGRIKRNSLIINCII